MHLIAFPPASRPRCQAWSPDGRLLFIGHGAAFSCYDTASGLTRVATSQLYYEPTDIVVMLEEETAGAAKPALEAKGATIETPATGPGASGGAGAGTSSGTGTPASGVHYLVCVAGANGVQVHRYPPPKSSEERSSQITRAAEAGVVVALLESFAIAHLALSPRQDLLAVAATDGHIGVWHTAPRFSAVWHDVVDASAGRVTSLSMSPDEDTLAVGCWGSVVLVYMRAITGGPGGEQRRSWALTSKCSVAAERPRDAAAAAAGDDPGSSMGTLVCWAPGGRHLAATSGGAGEGMRVFALSGKGELTCVAECWQGRGRLLGLCTARVGGSQRGRSGIQQASHAAVAGFATDGYLCVGGWDPCALERRRAGVGFSRVLFQGAAGAVSLVAAAFPPAGAVLSASEAAIRVDWDRSIAGNAPASSDSGGTTTELLPLPSAHDPAKIRAVVDSGVVLVVFQECADEADGRGNISSRWAYLAGSGRWRRLAECRAPEAVPCCTVAGRFAVFASAADDGEGRLAVDVFDLQAEESGVAGTAYAKGSFAGCTVIGVASDASRFALVASNAAHLEDDDDGPMLGSITAARLERLSSAGSAVVAASVLWGDVVVGGGGVDIVLSPRISRVRLPHGCFVAAAHRTRPSAASRPLRPVAAWADKLLLLSTFCGDGSELAWLCAPCKCRRPPRVVHACCADTRARAQLWTCGAPLMYRMAARGRWCSPRRPKQRSCSPCWTAACD